MGQISNQIGLTHVGPPCTKVVRVKFSTFVPFCFSFFHCPIFHESTLPAIALLNSSGSPLVGF